MHLGAQLGFNVLALDRPGYGLAADIDPARSGLQSQVEILFDAIDAWSEENKFGGQWFVIGHSVGGILTLLMAAHERSKRLSGVDVLGVPVRYPASDAGEAINSLPTGATMVPPISGDARKWLLFGPADTYAPQSFEYDATLARPMPVLEYRESLAIPDAWPEVLQTIKLPVQFALAEFEQMQATGWDVLNEVRVYLRNCKRARMELQYHTGHNASIHHIARSYHLRAIAFFEECLAVGQGVDSRADFVRAACGRS
jgi:pimeloyl-ACP methyl ester carboxylesterase